MQYHALTFRACSPDRIHIIRYEDLVRDPQGTLGNVCNKLGLLEPHSFSGPTWNREPLTEVYPWGTIRVPNVAMNKATAEELSPEEQERIRKWATPFLSMFGYESGISSL